MRNLPDLLGILRDRKGHRQVRFHLGADALLSRCRQCAAELDYRRRVAVGDGRQEARNVNHPDGSLSGSEREPSRHPPKATTPDEQVALMEKSAFFSNKLLPYLLLVPQLIITLVFFYWPASQAVWQSFLREDAFGLTSEFVGLENYQSLFAQPEYYASMLVTVVFSSLVAALSLSIALF